MSDRPAAEVVRRIRERRVVPWTLAYIAGAWLVFEATQSLADIYGWPDWIVPRLPVVLGFGVLTTITIAWYHGAAGWQRVTKQEAGLHVAIGASLVITLLVNPPGAPETHDPTDFPPTRVAVLYFKDHSAGEELRPLSSDLTEAVVHRLAQVPALEVLPLTAVEEFRGTGTPYDSIIAALEAGSLVEGSLTRLEDDIAVTTQLFEAGSRVHQASWVHRRPDSLRAAVVTEVADSISHAIRTSIGRKVRERRVRTSTDVPEARDVFRRAEAILSNEAGTTWREDRERGVELLDEADRLLAEAERLDPGWIEPTLRRIDVAETRAQLMGGAGTMDRAVLRTAIEHATRALKLTADSAALLERRGLLRSTLAQYSDAETASRLRSEAEADLRHASRLDGDRPQTWWALSEVMRQQGSLESAYEYATKAYETDSFLELTSSALAKLCETALDLKRFDEARAWCLEGRRLAPPGGGQDLAMNLLAYAASLPDPGPEDVEMAWAYVDTVAAEGLPDRRPSWRGFGEMLVAVTLATAGLPDSADAVMARAQATLHRHAEANMQAAGDLFEAVALLRMERYEAVFSALEDYVEQYPGRAERLSSDWWFEALWDDPRFIALYGGTPTEALGRD